MGLYDEGEAKADAMRRLMDAGLWEEASEYRTSERKRLRKQGMKQLDAREEAWRNMMEKYPPSGPVVSSEEVVEEEVVEDSDEVEALCRRYKNQDVDLVEDILWTYAHLSYHGISPSDCPSAGAWNMLKWAKRAENKFMESMLPKALVLKQKQRDIEANWSDEQEKLQNFLKGYEDLYGPKAQELEKLQADRERFWEQRKAESYC